MILSRILGFLDDRQVASVDEIAAAVGSPPAAVKGMLDTLQRRELVRRYRPQPGCGSTCRQCAQGSVEYYASAAHAPPEGSCDRLPRRR